MGFVRKHSLECDMAAVLPEVSRVFEKKMKVIEIASGTAEYTLKLSRIIAFEVFMHDMTVYYFDDTKLTVRYTLKKIASELENYAFVKISRSTLLNLNYIDNISRDMAVMKNGRKFYISSRNITEVKNRLKKIDGEKYD